MHLKEEDVDMDVHSDAAPVLIKGEASLPNSGFNSRIGTPANYAKRQSRSESKLQSAADSSAVKSDEEEVGGDITLKQEPGKPPKLSRSTSHKIEKRAPQMYHEYEDKTAEATSTFEVLPECTYANKYLGTTEHALECDCSEEWGKTCQISQPKCHS
jgi:histone-lysine N-methyltransferase SETD2